MASTATEAAASASQTPSPSNASHPRFSPAEETSLLNESKSLKATANAQFASADFSSAISSYDRALASCPNYLDYDIALLKSNIAACHLKLADWKAAVESANAALDSLERLLPSKPAASRKERNGEVGPDAKASDGKPEEDTADDAVVELDAAGDDTEEEALRKLNLSDQRRADIARIRTKSLMRRARAKSELGGWGNLQGAEDDYKTLATMNDSLPPPDKKIVHAALRDLPLRVKEARESEMGEMMGKLKELGNGLLKPFGLSTDMFNMTKDEKTGGYSMSVNQGG